MPIKKENQQMITHDSALEALQSTQGAQAFDYLADLFLLPYNAVQKASRVGVDFALHQWHIHAQVIRKDAVAQVEQEVLL